MNFGENLKRIRKLRNLKQATVAEKLGVERPTYTNYELGRRFPDLATLKKIARILNVSADDLLGIGPIKKDHDFEELLSKLKQLKKEDLYLVEGYVDKLIEHNKQIEQFIKKRRGEA